MRKNIIILTAGLAGSSVLTSIFAKSGYWTGDKTIKKRDYDTWENDGLVAHNLRILSQAGFEENWEMEFRPEFIDTICSNFDKVDPEPVQSFVAECNDHAPWIWKDPRLWLTIRYWKQFLDMSNTAFLVIRRDLMQAWISTTLRRQIQTVDYLRRYNDGIHKTIIEFVRDNEASYVDILYEDLILNPQDVLKQINDVAGTSLTQSEFEAVFRGTLNRRQHGLKNYLKAKAIYFKNYHLRYR